MLRRLDHSTGAGSPLQPGLSVHIQSPDQCVRGYVGGIAELCWTWIITPYTFLSFALVFCCFSKAVTSLFFFSGHVCEKFLNRMLNSDPMRTLPECAFLCMSPAFPMKELGKSLILPEK